jgi:hypothetical protein
MLVPLLRPPVPAADKVGEEKLDKNAEAGENGSPPWLLLFSTLGSSPCRTPERASMSEVSLILVLLVGVAVVVPLTAPWFSLTPAHLEAQNEVCPSLMGEITDGPA